MSAVEAPAHVLARCEPLLQTLRRHHRDGIAAVIAYGSSLEAGWRGPIDCLVVLEDCSATMLRASAAEVGQLCRGGLQPLFIGRAQLAASLDVFPLELLHMRADYAVVTGEDLLAPMTFERGALRLQTEEEARGLLSVYRQEVARQGHRPKAMRAAVAQASAALVPVWRGLLQLRGEPAPADVGALLDAVAEAYALNRSELNTYTRIEHGLDTPNPPELWQVVDRFDAFLASLVQRIDTMGVG